MGQLTIIRTNSDSQHFRELVSLLDQDLRIRDGDEHAFYSTYNKIDTIAHALVAYRGTAAVGCGAIWRYSDGVVEIKRMYVLPDHRGRGSL